MHMSNNVFSNRTSFGSPSSLHKSDSIFGAVQAIPQEQPESTFKQDLKALPPLFTLEEERSRKHLYITELLQGLEKTNENGHHLNLMHRISEDTLLIADRLNKLAKYQSRKNLNLDAVAALFNDDYDFSEDRSVEILQSVILEAKKLPREKRAEFFYTVADQVAKAIDPESTDEKYPMAKIAPNDPVYDVAETATTNILYTYYERIDDAIDPEKLREYMKEVAHRLDYYTDENGVEHKRGVNIVAIGGSINAGKGTTCSILGLEVAQSGTEGAVGRGGNSITFKMPGTQGEIVTMTREEIVQLDAYYRANPPKDDAEKELREYVQYQEAMKKITWYDRYELLTRGFDRARFKNKQVPNKFMTAVFGDVMFQVRQQLDAEGKFTFPVALDGAPRNDKQAEDLLGFLDKGQLGVLFYQNINEETSAIRSLGRAVESFARSGQIREDELVGFDFDKAPKLRKYFAMENGELTETARKAMLATIESAEQKGTRIDIEAQDTIRDFLARNNETIALVKLENKKDKTDNQGRVSSRYWIYLDWKQGFINACSNLGMRVVEVDCDKMSKDDVAAVAADAMGINI